MKPPHEPSPHAEPPPDAGSRDAGGPGPPRVHAHPHPFERHPHRTLLALSAPMLGSLVAEPLTGLVDTLLVGRLGASPLAALGAAASLLSLVLWAFNFLGIGTQTEVARTLGAGQREAGREAAALAIAIGALAGLALAALGAPLARPALEWMGTRGAATQGAVTYLHIRLLGAPAVLITMAAFGALRGLQEMGAALRVALLTNLANLLLDLLLIFGPGPFPRLELAGAGWAATAAQWLGAVLAVRALLRRIGRPERIGWRRAGALFAVGADLLVRTGLLLVFLTLGVREATRIGTDAGAAHAVIRQVWMFSAFALDAFAHVAQSLVGYFIGRQQRALARRVAAVCVQWSVALGVALGAAMLAGTSLAMAALPAAAREVAPGAWRIAALVQPVSAVSFATDGIHWGTGDYRFLRNAMALAFALGVAALLALEPLGMATLEGVWIATALFLGVRGAAGLLRVWPGIGRAAPLAGQRAGQ